MLASTTKHPINLNIESAEGSYLIDVEGKKYLDFTAGIAVNALGHTNPEIENAITNQLSKHSHVMVYGEYRQNVVNDFAHQLTGMLPPFLNTVYPLNSGTEAIEAALKIAKRHTKRNQILSFTGAYHGNTHGSMSVSHNEKKKSSFRPLLPNVSFLEWNDIDDLKKITEKTACVILETIQGDAGVRVPSQAFMKMLREKCTETGTLLILDEIQCGYGRTGKFSAFEHFGIVPDILCLGKALGAGLPIGAVVSNHSIMDCITSEPELGHITTFGGNPIVCAAALAGLKKYQRLENQFNIEEKGRLIEDLLAKYPLVKDFRRKGLMIGIDLPSAILVAETIEQCRKNGLLLFWFLSVPHGFRISPPLSISKIELEAGCNIILSALNELSNSSN